MAQKDADPLDRYRQAEIARARRETTSGDDAGARWLVGSILAHARDPAGMKLIQCGRPNPRSTGLVFCYLPACPVCSHRRGWSWFLDRVQPELGAVPPAQCRWITCLMPLASDLDQVTRVARSYHRKLQTSFKRFVIASGKNVRIWASREVERQDTGWRPHIHALVDLAGADPDEFAGMLRYVFGRGNREVHVESMKDRSQAANLARLSQYMTKVRYTHKVDGRDRWMTDQDIVDFVRWRNRLPPTWNRFTMGVFS